MFIIPYIDCSHINSMYLDPLYSVIKIPLILIYLQGSVYEKKRPELEINAAAKNKFWADREVSTLSFF